MNKIIVIICICLLQANILSAQEVFNTLTAGEQRVYSSFEMDPVFNIMAGYARSFRMDALNRDITFAANLTLPIFLLDMKHYTAELATRISLVSHENLKVVNRLSLINKGNDNPVYNGNMVSVKEGLLFGIFKENWFLSGEIGYEKFLLVRLEHTDWYRELVYESVKDGWYSSTGGNISFGFQVGYTIANKIELAMRAGIYKTEGFRNPAGAPVYGSLAVSYHF